MACGLHQGVVWCQTDLFWLTFIGLLVTFELALIVILAYIYGQTRALDVVINGLQRASEELAARDDQSPSGDGPTTQTATEKILGTETCMAEHPAGRCIKSAGHNGPHKTTSVTGEPETWGHDE